MAPREEAGGGGETEALFALMAATVESDGPKMVRKVGASFRFKVGPEGCWVVDLREGKGKVVKGDTMSMVDATVELSDEDFALICRGKLKPQEAFMSGKMAVKGNVMLATKLNPLIRMLRSAAAAAAGGGEGARRRRPGPRARL